MSTGIVSPLSLYAIFHCKKDYTQFGESSYFPSKLNMEQGPYGRSRPNFVTGDYKHHPRVEDKDRVQHSENEVVQSLPIPEYKMGWIVGKGGSYINQLSRKSGAKLTISESTSKEYGFVWKYVQIKGTGRAVDRAKKLLHIRLERLEPRSDLVGKASEDAGLEEEDYPPSSAMEGLKGDEGGDDFAISRYGYKVNQPDDNVPGDSAKEDTSASPFSFGKGSLAVSTEQDERA